MMFIYALKYGEEFIRAVATAIEMMTGWDAITRDTHFNEFLHL